MIMVIFLASCSSIKVVEVVEVRIISEEEKALVEENRQHQFKIEQLEIEIAKFKLMYESMSERDKKLASTYDRLLKDYRSVREKALKAINTSSEIFSKYQKLMDTFQKVVDSNEGMKSKLKNAAKENTQLKQQIDFLKRENFKWQNQE